MLFLTGLVFCSAFVLTKSSVIDHSDDFYWRDYNGEVPKDALPGGMDRDHNPTYIGQAVSSSARGITYYPQITSLGALVPGQIIRGVKKMYYYGDYSPRVETENIKIFCTKHPENFEWVKTNVNDVKYLSKIRLIPGGFSNSEDVYIGRGIAENTLAVGKVIVPNDSRSSYFKTSVNGNGYSPNEFEILSYRLRNPDYSSSNKENRFTNRAILTVIMLVLCLFY